MKEIDLGGIYVSPFAIHLLEAAAIFLVLRWVLARTGILDKVWYLALAEMALFILILFIVVALN